MDDIWIYLVRFPHGVHEAVLPCLDGHTVYIDDRLSEEERRKAYNHALKHIQRGDFSGGDAGQIEKETREME